MVFEYLMLAWFLEYLSESEEFVWEQLSQDQIFEPLTWDWTAGPGAEGTAGASDHDGEKNVECWYFETVQVSAALYEASEPVHGEG